jgi:beta-lactamase superfamily II metal-dependent hydrolase
VADFAINVDFAVLRTERKEDRTLLAWGDAVTLVGQTPTELTVEVPDWIPQSDGSLKPITKRGTLPSTVRVPGVAQPVPVALSADQVKLLKVSFVDVQQGDGTLIQTPTGKVITVDGGENQLFARFLASRFRGTSPQARQHIDAMVVTHGDADHFAGLTEIQKSETLKRLREDKRLFVHPDRVFHNGLVKRPSAVAELKSFGATTLVGDDPVITELETDLLAVPEAEMNTPFKAWRKALAAWAASGPIAFRRLAEGDDDAFAFLAEDGITVEVLGPIETMVNGAPGLRFLRAPKEGVPLDDLDFQPGGLSASHTINGHSIVLRLTFGNYRMLFAGDLNNAAEAALVARHAADGGALESEVFKVPHHGSHEFERGFLRAVRPLVSVVSSGDEDARKEYIHPRATLMNALGRHSRSDAGIVFVTELVAFFQVAGWSVLAKPPAGKRRSWFFGFRRAAFGCVRVRTDGTRMLVFTDSGKRDLKESYAYVSDAPGTTRRVDVVKA